MKSWTLERLLHQLEDVGMEIAGEDVPGACIHGLLLGIMEQEAKGPRHV